MLQISFSIWKLLKYYIGVMQQDYASRFHIGRSRSINDDFSDTQIGIILFQIYFADPYKSREWCINIPFSDINILISQIIDSIIFKSSC